MDAFHGSTPVVVSGVVDNMTVGSYTITYTATDLDNNTATASRTVNVVDTTAPVVTVTGDNPATVELGATYTDAGASATDLSGSVTVVTTGTVDSNTVGTYTLTYTSTDASGNAGTATRTVNVVDTTAPVFTSSATFIVDENQTNIGTVTATDLAAVTFTISDTSVMSITSAGVLTFITAIDYEDRPGLADSFTFEGETKADQPGMTAVHMTSPQLLLQQMQALMLQPKALLLKFVTWVGSMIILELELELVQNHLHLELEQLQLEQELELVQEQAQAQELVQELELIQELVQKLELALELELVQEQAQELILVQELLQELKYKYLIKLVSLGKRYY